MTRRSCRIDERTSACSTVRSTVRRTAGAKVVVTESLVAEGTLARTGAAFAVTKVGARRFAALGLDLAAVAAQRRQFASACMDWSERRDHIGGALGAALARHFATARWIRRQPDSRAVAVTATGRQELRAHFGWVSAED